MKWSFVIIILNGWLGLNQNILSVTALPDISTLCPYNDFCTSSAIKIKEPKDSHLFPCCQKCSCEPDCQLFGNCCPDKALDPDIQVKYPCVTFDKYLNEPRNMYSMEDNILQYRIVDDCPSLLLSATYPRCYAFDDLEDLVAVSDPVTERVYKNKHCALCNGVKHYKEWQLLTSCGLYNVHSFSSRLEWYSFIAKNCSVSPWPPKWTDGLSVKCTRNSYKREVTKCNDTGTWKLLDDDVKDACETHNPYTNSNLYRETNGIPVLYDTAYCKLCNPEDNQVWPDLCKRTTLFNFIRTSFSFSSFINFQKEDTAVKNGKNCLENEIWDNYNDVCRAVICPSSTFYLKEKCELVFLSRPGQAFEILFEVAANTENYVWKREDVEFIDVVIRKMFENEDCYQCGTYLVQYWNVFNVTHAKYEVQSQGTCTLQFLVNRIKELIAKPVDAIRKNNSTSFIVSPELDLNILNLFDGLFITNVHFCSSPKYIDWSMVDACPRMVIPEEFMSNITSFNPTTVRGGTICVTEYFDILKSSHNSQARLYSELIILQFLFMTLYMLRNVT